jgi:hypothetical protein
MEWFKVDKEGLAKILARRGLAFAVYELVQNAWDTRAKRVDVVLEPLRGEPYVTIRVTDNDPEGFSDLAHAFTLFAESKKKSDPELRGRFNLGEKLVLALCRSAEIVTTSGAVFFDEEGRRETRKTKQVAGSSFTGVIRMTREELVEVRAALGRLIPPEAIETLVDGEALPRRPLAHSFKAKLPTEVADEGGLLRRTERDARVSLHALGDGETPHLYEMGIPITDLQGMRWHVNVHQKVPLTLDREGVPTSFMRRLHVEVLNAAHHLIGEDDSTKTWVREAAGNHRAATEAVERTLDLRFGKKRVAYDPSDPEANGRAACQGYTVVHGGSLSSGEWQNARASELLPAAGKVLPTPKVYSPDGRPEKVIYVDEWTTDMGRYARRARAVARTIFGENVEVAFVSEPTIRWGANYGGRRLCVNVGRLGHAFFDRGNEKSQLSLMIHEYGHEYESNHLSSDYHEAICSIGSKLALTDRSLWWPESIDGTA